MTCNTPLLYHCINGELPPLVGFAVNTTEEPEHTVVDGVVTKTDGTTVPVMVMTICELVAVLLEAQVAVEVSTHHTESLFAKVLSVYVFAFVPTAEPSLYHWYIGFAPVLVVWAVNVTAVPEHIVVCVAVTEIVGVTIGLTVILTLLLLTVIGEVQFELDVSTHHTESVLAILLVPYVAVLAPTFTPFFFH